jgi:putative ubiquitin-RnfH superfamily antitoxin RatB of RatAB toxin-antitoxin module
MAIAVTVAYAAPGTEAIVGVTVADGATVADAVAASGLCERLALTDSIAFAIHGQAAAPATPLADGDRVEITRPLVADAKAVRRARAAQKPLPRTRKVKRRRG